MWLVTAALLGAALLGLGILALCGVILWRSGRRFLSTLGTLSDRAARASAQLGDLTSRGSSEPVRLPGRTM